MLRRPYRTITPYEKFQVTVRNAVGSEFSGTIIVESDREIAGTLSYQYLSSMFTTYQAVRLNKTLYFPKVYDVGTWRNYLSVVNTGSVNATITARYYDGFGNEIVNETQVLAPNAKYHRNPRDVVGAEYSGTIIVESDQPLAGMLTYHYPNTMFTIYEAVRPIPTI